MKYILNQEQIDIPDDVQIKFKNRIITVKGCKKLSGKHGEISKNFKHQSFTILKEKGKKTKHKLRLQMFLQKKKQSAVIGSITSQIRNMVTGVSEGYKFKMVLAYAHFPIIINILDNGRAIEIRNFLGIKMNQRVDCFPGVIIQRKQQQKNIFTVSGTDLTNVSLTCAVIRQSVKIRHKDLRHFLDGIYVSEKRLSYND